LTRSFPEALVAIRSEDEAKAFIQVFFSPQEAEDFDKRWRAMELGTAGVPQTQIRNEVGISRETASRCVRALRSDPGDPGVIAMLVSRLNDNGPVTV
jgi:uncharacterized protein YerC